MLTSIVLASALAWQPAVTVATGPGEKGEWRQNDSHYRYVDDPSVALADSGDALVAWADQARKDVYLQRFGVKGEPRGKPVNLSRNPETFSWLPRVATSGLRVYALWQEIIFTGGSHGGDILFARSEDGGASFSEPLNLSARSLAGDGKGRITREHWDNGSLDLAVAADGTLYTAWTEYEGTLWLARSADGGRTFQPRQRIAGDDAQPARAPALAVGGTTLHIAWTTGDIHVRSGEKTRTFKRRAGYADAPKLAVDGRGALHLVYAEDGVVYHSAGMAPARPISPKGAAFPSLAVSEDKVHVLWEAGQGLAWTVSADGGESFSTPASVPGTGDAPNGGNQGRLMRKLAVDRAGTVAVAHSSFVPGKSSRVLLVRATPK
ncbi:MAG TPA: hypothetical protein VD965_08500 [Burkholderiales bacterium]|nr:hypothetical protein [Burkholderiales bacterium]